MVGPLRQPSQPRHAEVARSFFFGTIGLGLDGLLVIRSISLVNAWIRSTEPTSLQAVFSTWDAFFESTILGTTPLQALRNRLLPGGRTLVAGWVSRGRLESVGGRIVAAGGTSLKLAGVGSCPRGSWWQLAECLAGRRGGLFLRVWP